MSYFSGAAPPPAPSGLDGRKAYEPEMEITYTSQSAKITAPQPHILKQGTGAGAQEVVSAQNVPPLSSGGLFGASNYATQSSPPTAFGAPSRQKAKAGDAPVFRATDERFQASASPVGAWNLQEAKAGAADKLIQAPASPFGSQRLLRAKPRAVDELIQGSAATYGARDVPKLKSGAAPMFGAVFSAESSSQLFGGGPPTAGFINRSIFGDSILSEDQASLFSQQMTPQFAPPASAEDRRLSSTAKKRHQGVQMYLVPKKMDVKEDVMLTKREKERLSHWGQVVDFERMPASDARSLISPTVSLHQEDDSLLRQDIDAICSDIVKFLESRLHSLSSLEHAFDKHGELSSSRPFTYTALPSPYPK